MPDSTERRQFLTIAALFEGGLAFLAVAIGWLIGVDPMGTFRVTPESVSRGVIATAPMLVLFWVSMHSRWAPFRTIREFLLEWFAPYLVRCRWYDLLTLAVLAGLGEELLFRGLLQAWATSFGGLLFGLIAASIVFGLAHALTPTYFLLATGMGAYLGWIWVGVDEPNLLTPVVTHTVYDWLAFWYVVRVKRMEPGDVPDEEPPATPAE
jgi:membrane protease YdiL (CAAX protease family)